MPYADHFEQLQYYQMWYFKNREHHIKNTSDYYYKNKNKILKQHKLKYKNSKK